MYCSQVGVLQTDSNDEIIFHETCKELRRPCNDLLLLILLVFLNPLRISSQYIVDHHHDDFLVANLRGKHGVGCLGLDLTRQLVPQGSHQKVR